jgi:hypothetical protein
MADYEIKEVPIPAPSRSALTGVLEALRPGKAISFTVPPEQNAKSVLEVLRQAAYRRSLRFSIKRKDNTITIWLKDQGESKGK